MSATPTVPTIKASQKIIDRVSAILNSGFSVLYTLFTDVLLITVYRVVPGRGI